MLWCLFSLAMLCTLLGLAALSFKPSSLRRFRPGRAARGCVAALMFLLAILLASSALALGPSLSSLIGG